VYATIGFARIIGTTALYVSNGNSNASKKSFGSFYPTFGLGAEYKMTYNWNIRMDVRFSITSRDEKAAVARDAGGTWSTAGRPNRAAVRISVTRSI
jgi:hypothetical protein